MSDDPHLKEKYAALRYGYEQFDKSVTFIASGALGISFSFIDKLVDLKTAACKGLLIWSWIVFGAVIFLSLALHFLSIWSITWAIEHHNDTVDYKKREKAYNLSIRVGNICTLPLLLLGMILLILFINTNIQPNMSDNNNKQDNTSSEQGNNKHYIGDTQVRPKNAMMIPPAPPANVKQPEPIKDPANTSNNNNKEGDKK